MGERSVKQFLGQNPSSREVTENQCGSDWYFYPQCLETPASENQK